MNVTTTVNQQSWTLRTGPTTTGTEMDQPQSRRSGFVEVVEFISWCTTRGAVSPQFTSRMLLLRLLPSWKPVPGNSSILPSSSWNQTSRTSTPSSSTSQSAEGVFRRPSARKGGVSCFSRHFRFELNISSCMIQGFLKSSEMQNC